MDAYHVAIAAVNGIEYLLTWNCAHIANAHTRPKIEFACRALGYEPPIICTPDEARNPSILNKLRVLLDKNLEVLIPNYKEQLKWAIYPVIWHLDGVAKTIEKDKPEISTPIKNLYLVGDCVKAPGIGFNCALNSALILCENYIKIE